MPTLSGARALALVIFLLAAVGLRAQHVRTAEWGFDGTVVPGRFNLLSVLVVNPTDDPLETELILTRRTTLGGRLGAPIVRPCFVSPRSERWVQFTPYVTGRRQPWRVRFAREELGGLEISRPTAGPPAVVMLHDDPAGSALSYAIKLFAPERFPPSVTGTEGLGAVVLDREPRWDRARRLAFLDWVRSGGVVHLVRTFGGHTVFESELADLNGDSVVTRVAAGRVIRHEFSRDQLRRRVPPALSEPAPVPIDEIEQVIAGALRPRVRIAHAWWLIDLLAIVYVLAVGPGVLWIARGNASWPRVLLALVAVIVVGSLALSTAGGRGGGEHAKTHSLSYARSLGDGRWNVIQHAASFVRIGGDYRVLADGTDDVFSTAQVHEPVPGLIREVPEASLDLAMPQFSWRSFVHQRVRELPPFEVAFVSGAVAGETPAFRIVDAPSDLRIFGGLTVIDGHVWPLEVGGGKLGGCGPPLPVERLPQVVHELLTRPDVRTAVWLGGAIGSDLTAAIEALILHRMFGDASAWRDDIATLIVLASWDALAPAAEGLGTHDGVVLLRLEFPLPRKK